MGGDSGSLPSPDTIPRALRPREKLLARGPRALSHGELLSLVLGHRSGTEPSRRIANRLMRRHRLSALAELSPADWRAEPGLGPATAGSFGNLYPVFSAAIAVAALGEPFEWYHGVGGVAVLAGIWLASVAREAVPAGGAAKERGT